MLPFPRQDRLSALRTPIAIGASWCALFCANSFAQPSVDVDQQQRRLDERARAEREQLEKTPEVRLERPAANAMQRLTDGESPCFAIREVVFKSTTPFAMPALSASLAGSTGDDSPIGRCLGAKGINLLLQRVQDAWIAAGFVTTRVLAEPQDLKQGTLVFTVVPGRVSGVRPAGAAPQRVSLGSALPMRPGDLLNLRDIEQGLENLKRVPTAEADIRIEPGPAVGQSDLVVKWEQGRLMRLGLSLDDGGSRATGRMLAGITLSVDNALTLSDLFYVTLNSNAQADSQRQGTGGNSAHYSLPWGYWLFSVNAGHSRFHQTVAGANADIVFSGRTETAEFKASRVAYRDAQRKTTLALKGFQRRSSNFIDDLEVQVQRRVVGGWEASLAHREHWGESTLDATLAWRRGTGAFGALPAPEEDTGQGTSRFGLVSVDAGLQLPFTLAQRSLTYVAQWRAQFNRTSLSPQERFAIGGRYTVRGFDGESSLASERGWLWRNEVNLPLPALNAQAYVALDHGHVGGPSATALRGRSLTGAALGLRGSVPGSLTAQYEVFVGAPVHKPQGFSTAGTTAGFSLNLSF